jgi:hypothetical protein
MPLTWRAITDATTPHPRVPNGRYASDAVDQHAASWCGCCYLVAAAQTVQDRAHIALARARVPHARPRVSLQSLLDHFVEFDAGLGWNACHGGFPLHVLHCLADGRCPLVLARVPNEPWFGFPRAVERCPRPDAAEWRVVHPRRVRPEDVLDALLDGPLVLEVSAETCKRVDARGVTVDLTPRPSDHAVSVVGWTHAPGDGTRCWIVRNSWGAARVPRDVPDDMDVCVGRGHNTCSVAWEPWSGMPSEPGFLLLPTSYAPLHADAPSPWVVATVHVA